MEAVRRDGKRFRTPHLEVRAVASLFRHSRVGVIVPLHKHTKVARNTLKRRLRELSRSVLLSQLRAQLPVDVVIRALPAAYDAPFDTLASEVQRTTDQVVRRMDPRV